MSLHNAFFQSYVVEIHVDSTPPTFSIPVQAPQFQQNVDSEVDSIFFASRLLYNCS